MILALLLNACNTETAGDLYTRRSCSRFDKYLGRQLDAREQRRRLLKMYDDAVSSHNAELRRATKNLLEATLSDKGSAVVRALDSVRKLC